MVMSVDRSHRKRRERGAVVGKVLLAIAAGVGAVWIAARSTMPPAPTESSRAVAGPIAVGAPLPAPEVARTPPAVVADTQGDPFAGVDVSKDSVLRQISRIEEKSRAKAAPRERDAARAVPEAAAPARTRSLAAQVVVREGATVESTVPPSPATSAALPPPLPEAPRVASAQTVLPVDTSATRPVDAAPSGVQGAAKPVAPPVPTAPAASGDRVLVATLGATPPPVPATHAPLRVMQRTLPAFPVEAVRAGVRTGRVVARLTIEADGHVSGAEIISAAPIGYFERESRRAFATWRYEPPGHTTSADVELVFNQE